MGGSSSRVYSSGRSDEPHLVIEIVSAANVPTPIGGVHGGEDPHVVAKLYDKFRGRRKGARLRTPVILKNKNPVWFCRRSFGVPAADADLLMFHLWDKNILRDGYIDHVKIQVAHLQSEAKDFPLTVRASTRLRTSLSNCRTPPSLRIRRLPIFTGEIHKTVYFIRHGTSLWNQAQADKAYSELLGKDHPLNARGVEQCEALRKRWTSRASGAVVSKAPLGSLQRHFESQFTSCQAVFTSPLTRAVQTALIALNGHPATQNAPVVCMRSAREIKGVGGRDCLGKVSGDNIEKRARHELAAVSSDEFVNGLNVRIHPGDSNSEWWTYIKDTKRSTRGRFHDFWQCIRFCEADKIIITGHSNFFKKLLKNHAQNAACDNAKLREILVAGKHKLNNASVLACDVRFLPGRQPQIVNTSLCFQSGLYAKRQEQHMHCST